MTSQYQESPEAYFGKPEHRDIKKSVKVRKQILQSTALATTGDHFAANLKKGCS